MEKLRTAADGGFEVGTCKGCRFEEFDYEMQKYACNRHNCVLGGSRDRHPIRLLFCSEFKEW